MRQLLSTLLLLAVLGLGVVESTAQQATAYLRVAHFSPDTPPLELWFDGVRSPMPPLATDSISGWAEVAAGRHEIAFVPSGGALDDALVGPFTVELAAGSWSTIPVLGQNETGSVYAIWLEDSAPTTVPDGMTRLIVFNGVPGGAALDLYDTSGSLLTRNVRFGRAAQVDIRPGWHDLRFSAADASSSVSTGTVLLEMNATYLLGTVRRQSGGGVVLHRMMDDGQSVAMTTSPVAATATTVTGAFAPTNTVTIAPTVMATTTPSVAPTVTTMAPASVTATATLAPQASATPAGSPTPTRPPSEWMTIVDMIGTSPLLSISRRAIDQVGLTERVARDRWTFFVPTDDAWRDLVDNFPDLLPDAASIRRVVAYHLVNEPIATDIMFDQMTLLTLRGAFMRITRQDGSIVIDGRARIIVPDVQAVNGTIHVIDAVLVPPDMRPPELRPVRPLG